MKKIFDLSKLVSISIKGKVNTWGYFYHKKSTNWYGKEIKEGFYYYGEFQGSSVEIVSNNNKLMVEDNVLYYKPSVTLKFVDGSETVKYFQNFAMANKFGHELASKHFTSKLEIKE